ncbi:hypothetical protein [Curtobacterium ammoniigenes]|uniref:hypothetical protein n=1 Tax=Curtobacterium ammoniigenes TaxID=395387 RepID=UPI00082BD784|nr:hypothetical protein [Curtobacterium ammoniigenes]
MAADQARSEPTSGGFMFDVRADSAEPRTTDPDANAADAGVHDFEAHDPDGHEARAVGAWITEGFGVRH